MKSDSDLSSDFNWPRITVVTPSYNQGQFIEETILSVISQGYPNLEYIIIDGGSTDNTIEIIKKYEKFIYFWISEPDSGQSNGINKGFLKGTGDIFSWINSDDLYSAGTLFKMAEIFVENPDFDFIYGDCIYINEKNEQIFYFTSHQFDLQKLLKSDFIPQPSAFWRSRILKSVGYLNESFRYTMDYEYWIRISIKFSMRYVPIPFSRFRWHSQSKSIAETNKFLLDHLKIYDYVINNQQIQAEQKKEIFFDILWSYFKAYIFSENDLTFTVTDVELSPELKRCLERCELFLKIKTNKIIRLNSLEKCLSQTWICLKKLVDNNNSLQELNNTMINNQYSLAADYAVFLFNNGKWLLSLNLLLIILIKKPKLLLKRSANSLRYRLNSQILTIQKKCLKIGRYMRE